MINDRFAELVKLATQYKEERSLYVLIVCSLAICEAIYLVRDEVAKANNG